MSRDIQFGRIPYAIVDDGLLAELKPAACKVLVVIAAHANADYRASLGMRRIGRLAGIELGSVSRSVKELVAASLLNASASGRGHPMQYEILVPSPTKCSPTSEHPMDISVGAGVNAAEGECSPSRGGSVHPVAQKCSPGSERNRKNREDKQTDCCSDVFSCLQKVGVKGRALERLARLDGLTALDVTSVLKRAKAKANNPDNPVGLLIKMLDNGERADDADHKAARGKAWDQLGPRVHAELLKDVQDNDPSTLHIMANIDTQRAMRKLAKERGMLE